MLAQPWRGPPPHPRRRREPWQDIVHRQAAELGILDVHHDAPGRRLLDRRQRPARGTWTPCGVTAPSGAVSVSPQPFASGILNSRSTRRFSSGSSGAPPEPMKTMAGVLIPPRASPSAAMAANIEGTPENAVTPSSAKARSASAGSKRGTKSTLLP